MSLRYIGLWFVGLVIIAGAIFHPGLNGPFVIDDIAKIRDNPTIRNPDPRLGDFFNSYESQKTHFRNDPSRPLTYMAYWALWHAGDGQTRYFHIASLVLHALTALLLGLIVLELLGPPATVIAIAASALFLFLPLNAGTVLYAFAMSDVLAAFFALALAFFALKQSRRPQPLGPTPLAVSAGLMILALMSKQSAVVIPALMLALLPRQKRLHITLFATALAYVGLRFLIYGRIGDIEAVDRYPPLTYFATQGAAFWDYLVRALIPHNLSLDHAIFPSTYATALKVVGWLAWLGAFIWAATQIAKKSSGPALIAAVGWLWFVFPLLPTGTFLPTTDIFVERRAYWSTAGLILFVAAWLAPIWIRGSTRAKVILTIITAIVLNTAALLTYRRAEVFSSDISIYAEITRIYPGDVRANSNLATAYLQAGRGAEALPILEGILERYPNEPNVLVNLAALHQSPEFGMVDLRRAGELLERVLKNEPDNLKALTNRGHLHLALMQFDLAHDDFAKALELSPCLAGAHYGLGKVSEFKGQIPEAIAHYKEAVTCDPSFFPAVRELQKRSAQ